jgi:hypothetical protein
MNPNGYPEDIILIMAYNEKNELAGFIGALPDRLKKVPGLRVAWNSCWWVDPVRGKEIGMQLFYRFLERWDKKVLFADLTPLTYNIISKTGFFKSGIRTGARGYLRMPLSEILPPKKTVFRILKWIFSACDSIFNIFWEIRLIIWKKRKHRNEKIKWFLVRDLDPDITELIQKESSGELIGRGEDEFDWIRDYPWVTPVKDKVTVRRYPFTYYAKRFEHHRVKITEDNKTIAFLIVTVRNNHLKVPYLYYAPGSLPHVVDFLLHFMISGKVYYITVFRKDISGYLLKHPMPMIWKKSIRRYTAISKDISDMLPVGHQMQDGDGDVVFT